MLMLNMYLLHSHSYFDKKKNNNNLLLSLRTKLIEIGILR